MLINPSGNVALEVTTKKSNKKTYWTISLQPVPPYPKEMEKEVKRFTYNGFTSHHPGANTTSEEEIAAALAAFVRYLPRIGFHVFTINVEPESPIATILKDKHQIRSIEDKENSKV